MIAHFRKKIVKTFQNKKHGQIETQFQASTGKEKSERIYSTREKFVFDVLQSKKKSLLALFIYLFLNGGVSGVKYGNNKELQSIQKLNWD